MIQKMAVKSGHVHIIKRHPVLVSGSWEESNSEMLWRNGNVDLLTTDNLLTAFRWLDDEVLDESSKKEINLLLSQQFTKARSTACHSNNSILNTKCFATN